jgi:hypothetical protein
MMSTMFMRVLRDKPVSRRCWQEQELAKHNFACEHECLVRLWCGGYVTAGHALYSRLYSQKFCCMTQSDVALEGFGEQGLTKKEVMVGLKTKKQRDMLDDYSWPLTVRGFCGGILGVTDLDKSATVLNFSFFPYNR